MLQVMQVIKSICSGIIVVAVVIVAGWGILALFTTHVGQVVGVIIAIGALAVVLLSFLFAVGDAFLDAVGWN